MPRKKPQSESEREASIRQIRSRAGMIAAADDYCGDVDRCLAEAAGSPERATRLRRRCARLLIISGGIYQCAGLGLQAKAALTRAAECFDLMGLPAKAEEYRGFAAEIPEHFNEPSGDS